MVHLTRAILFPLHGPLWAVNRTITRATHPHDPVVPRCIVLLWARKRLDFILPSLHTQLLSQIYTEMAQNSRPTAGNHVARSLGWMRLLLCVVTTSLSKNSSTWSTILILGITIKASPNRSAQHLNCVPSHMHHMLTQHVFRDLDQDEQPYSYFR